MQRQKKLGFLPLNKAAWVQPSNLLRDTSRPRFIQSVSEGVPKRHVGKQEAKGDGGKVKAGDKKINRWQKIRQSLKSHRLRAKNKKVQMRRRHPTNRTEFRCFLSSSGVLLSDQINRIYDFAKLNVCILGYLWSWKMNDNAALAIRIRVWPTGQHVSTVQSGDILWGQVMRRRRRRRRRKDASGLTAMAKNRERRRAVDKFQSQFQFQVKWSEVIWFLKPRTVLLRVPIGEGHDLFKELLVSPIGDVETANAAG